MKAGFRCLWLCDVASSDHQDPTIEDPVLQEQNVESYCAVLKRKSKIGVHFSPPFVFRERRPTSV